MQRRVEAQGRRFVPLRADLSDDAAVRRLAERLGSEAEPVDILVNNAGTIVRAPAAEHPDSAWDQVMAVNVSAQFRLARAAGSAMVRRGAGKIIFIASLLSLPGRHQRPQLRRQQARGARRDARTRQRMGVERRERQRGRARATSPPTTRGRCGRTRSAREPILERIPAGRWGRPEDVVGAVVFLAAPASDYVHGTVLAVDGGWLSR